VGHVQDALVVGVAVDGVHQAHLDGHRKNLKIIA
jgi:hypothetical protein